MRIFLTMATALSIAALGFSAPAAAQDEQIGQQGSVWTLGELTQRTYPSTVTAANHSCPGAHDFHISLQGEAAEFITIIGLTVLTDIPPGSSKTSAVMFDMRAVSPGPHNSGKVAVRCVDCPFTCSQDYDLLDVHLTVVGDALDSSVAGPPSPWAMIDLTSLDPTVPTPSNGAADIPSLRWITPDSLDRMTLAQDAIDDGLAELDFVGTGHPSGDIFTLTVTRNADTPFEMGFALGTILLPDDPAFSAMIVADDGAVALLDEVTTVTVPGYTLDPGLQQPPTLDQVNGGEGPGWSVLPPPDSGQFSSAVNIIDGGYALAGDLSTAVPLEYYLRTVVQRAIWFDTAPDIFNQERLGRDIVAQVVANDGEQSEDEIEEAAEVIWADILGVANMGKAP